MQKAGTYKIRLFLRICIHSQRTLGRHGILYPIKANFCGRAVARQENLTWSGGQKARLGNVLRL